MSGNVISNNFATEWPIVWTVQKREAERRRGKDKHWLTSEIKFSSYLVSLALLSHRSSTTARVQDYLSAKDDATLYFSSSSWFVLARSVPLLLFFLLGPSPGVE